MNRNMPTKVKALLLLVLSSLIGLALAPLIGMFGFTVGFAVVGVTLSLILDDVPVLIIGLLVALVTLVRAIDADTGAPAGLTLGLLGGAVVVGLVVTTLCSSQWRRAVRVLWFGRDAVDRADALPEGVTAPAAVQPDEPAAERS